jgi:hypothetical protein
MVDTVLQHDGVSGDQVVGIGTDGASAMTGLENGAITKLLEMLGRVVMAVCGSTLPMPSIALHFALLMWENRLNLSS